MYTVYVFNHLSTLVTAYPMSGSIKIVKQATGRVYTTIFTTVKQKYYLLNVNNLCKQAKENLLQCNGMSSTMSTGREHVRDAQRSRVVTRRCKI